MKIAVTGGKGGTGKSMVATSLAIEYAQESKVMLVDADVECPNDHLLLAIKRKKHSDVYSTIPKWDMSRCTMCGRCAEVCKQNAIVFVKNKHPAFVQDVCIGCKACMVACPAKAITESKKVIGTVHTGNNYGVHLVSGELKIGELASGEVVAQLRKESDRIFAEDFMIIDSAAGIGCPVIASLVGTDFIVAVTEPTPSALHDLKRVLHHARHFSIPHGLVINKHDLHEGFCKKIERFAADNGIEVLGKVPYSRDFLTASIAMKPVDNPVYRRLFKDMKDNISRRYP